jgi:PBP1b-binding outer membrane lipoprotein LpoB
MKKVIAFILLAVFLMGCASTNNVGWSKKHHDNKMQKRKY